MGLPGASVVSSRPEELVDSEVAELRGSVAPAACSEQICFPLSAEIVDYATQLV